MKKALALLLAGALLAGLSGCYRTDPTSVEEIKKFKEFRVACEEAGGEIAEYYRQAGYYCEMENSGGK